VEEEDEEEEDNDDDETEETVGNLPASREVLAGIGVGGVEACGADLSPRGD
jgi:hypothetical protein